MPPTQILDMVETSPGTFVFGQVQHPPFVDRLIPDHETQAWNDLGPMDPIGVCQHTMVGYLMSTDRWFRNEPGRRAQGLTTYGVGGPADGPALDGVILRWNDPRGKAHSVDYTGGDGVRHAGYVSPNRAGWANGGSDGLEGDGVMFVRTMGVDDINKLVSIERSDGGDPYNAPFAGKQFESCARLTAFWFDQAGVSWESFPKNLAVGIVTHLLHLEFAVKGCPHVPVVDRVDELQDRIRAILQAGQTHTEGAPAVPPPSPVVIDHGAWPGGYTEARLAKHFGKLKVHTLDGKETVATFDAKGPISNAWAARGAKERRRVTELPPPSVSVDIPSTEKGGPVARMVLFDGRGSDNWVLYRPTPDVAFRWVDLTKRAA